MSQRVSFPMALSPRSRSILRPSPACSENSSLRYVPSPPHLKKQIAPCHQQHSINYPSNVSMPNMLGQLSQNPAMASQILNQITSQNIQQLQQSGLLGQLGQLPYNDKASADFSYQYLKSPTHGQSQEKNSLLSNDINQLMPPENSYLEMLARCSCCPDLHSQIFGPTVDETILKMFRTLNTICSHGECAEKEEEMQSLNLMNSIPEEVSLPPLPPPPPPPKRCVCCRCTSTTTLPPKCRKEDRGCLCLLKKLRCKGSSRSQSRNMSCKCSQGVTLESFPSATTLTGRRGSSFRSVNEPKTEGRCHCCPKSSREIYYF